MRNTTITHETPELEPPPLRQKSKGEKVFDRAVYGGIAGVGTFALTLYMAYEMIHGRLSSRYNGSLQWVESKALRFFTPKTSKTIAKHSVKTTALMMGGNAMLLPIGLAEHYKTQIVSGLNVTLDDKTPPQAIEQAPKQTWWSLIEGRLLAWGVVFGSLSAAASEYGIPKTFGLFEQEIGEQTYKATQWLKRNKQPLTDMKEMAKTKSFRVGEIGAVDMFATAAAATLLYVGGHFFARKHEEKLERKAPSSAAHTHRDELELDRAQQAVAETLETAAQPSAKIQGEKTAHGAIARPTLSAQPQV